MATKRTTNRKRKLMTKEEAVEILKNRPTAVRFNKLSEFLKQDNVKAFNLILVNKAFDGKLANADGGCKPFVFDNVEECHQECVEFFELCLRYSMIPSIINLAIYLRTNPEVLRHTARNIDNPCCKIIKAAIDTCRGVQEQAALHGELNPTLFAFLGRNYYGMQETSTLNLTNNQDVNTVNNQNTMRVIQEQILLENNEQQPKNNPTD